jgi:hypothetical protein
VKDLRSWAPSSSSSLGRGGNTRRLSDTSTQVHGNAGGTIVYVRGSNRQHSLSTQRAVEETARSTAGICVTILARKCYAHIWTCARTSACIASVNALRASTFRPPERAPLVDSFAHLHDERGRTSTCPHVIRTYQYVRTYVLYVLEYVLVKIVWSSSSLEAWFRAAPPVAFRHGTRTVSAELLSPASLKETACSGTKSFRG